MIKIKIINVGMHMMFIVLMAYTYICVIYSNINEKTTNNIFIGIFLAVVAIFVYRIFKKNEEKLSNKKYNLIFFGILTAVLIGQIVLILKLEYVPISDPYNIDITSRMFAESGNFDVLYLPDQSNQHYFQNYPNNWAILMFLSGVYRLIYLIFGSISVYVSQIINLLMIQISAVLVYFTAKLIFKDKTKPLMCGIAFAIHPALITNLPIFYTDTFSLPFTIGSLFLFLKAIKAQKRSTSLLLLLATSITIAIGNSIKGNIAVLAVAFIIYGFAKLGWKKALCLTFSLIFCIVSSSKIIRYTGMSAGIATEEELTRYEMPVLHWVNMSLAGDGWFNTTERRWISQFKSKDEKNQQCVIAIKEKLSNYGVKGFLEHTYAKSTRLWHDGKMLDKLYDGCKNSSAKYFFTKGNSFTLYANGIHIMILTYMLISVIRGLSPPKINPQALARLCIFGLSLFFLMWEIKGRYLINSIPFMVIMAADGLDAVNGLLNNIKNRFSKTNKIETSDNL